MEIQGWVILNFYSALLLVLLVIFESRSIRTMAGRRFIQLDCMTLLLLLSETVGHIGEANPEKYLLLCGIGYYLIYILDPVDYLFFMLYINCWINKSYKKAQRDAFLWIYRAFVILNFVGVTIDRIFGLKWFYYFDGLEYKRGSLFLVRGALLLFFCVLISVYTIIYRKGIFRGYRFAIFSLPTIATLGACLQIFIVNMTTTYAAISIGLLILFIYLQSKNLDVDYLTGALNRRGLDIRLEEAVKDASAGGKVFSAIMLDLDRFKPINDTYGHSEGDEALKAVAEVLMKVFPENAFIGRFGGDEFCVISYIGDQKQLKEKIELVDDELDLYNYKSGKPYNIEVSMGYMVYDSESRMSAKDFQMAIDELMYEQKKKHHLNDRRR